MSLFRVRLLFAIGVAEFNNGLIGGSLLALRELLVDGKQERHLIIGG